VEVLVENMTSRGTPSSQPTAFVYFAAAFASLNSCNLGYDIGVNASIGYRLQQKGGSLQLSDLQLEAFMGVFTGFAVPGALSAYVVSDGLGRRKSFAVAALTFIVGIAWTISSGDLMSMLFGRAIMGLGVGFGAAIDPLYISEISPAQFRGTLVTWAETATNVGILLGFSVGAVFERGEFVSNDAAWRTMLALGMVMPAILIGLVYLAMPESPRWLISRGRSAEAINVLRRCALPGEDVERIASDIEEELAAERENDQKTTWRSIFCTPPEYLRRMLVVGVGVPVCQQLTGIESIQYYMLYILEASGVKSRGVQFSYLVGIGTLKVLVIVLAGRLFDHPRAGRRPLLMLSNLGLMLSLSMLALNFVLMDGGGSGSGGGSPSLAVFALLCFVTFFSLGMGPGAWLIPSEVFSLGVRAKAMSLATFCNRTLAAVGAATFLSLRSWLTDAGVTALFATFCFANFVFVAILMPETKGRTLEEMRRHFEATRFPCEKKEAAGRISVGDEDEDGGCAAESGAGAGDDTNDEEEQRAGEEEGTTNPLVIS
jgi:sugar porter (SP) family MFS transporter